MFNMLPTLYQNKIVMKSLVFTLFTLLLVAFSLNNIQAQNNYTEYQLPHPDQLSPLFVGSLTESAIYYGKTPSFSSNKPVLVFVHGFIDLANLWFAPGNDMYERAYDSRYRTAYVAMTRGEGMWTNGALLAEMLEDITDHYNVKDVVIVAHSNGGKASEVAMFYENKSHLVDRVISLGTPFKGTGVADLAETPAFNWLVDFIGLGGGTSTSTTYYMEGIARPILDNEPDNEVKKFINFGAWGYNDGTTIAAPIMAVSGELLNNMGGGPSTGGNDGVTPYYSSTRPGGSPQWPGYCAWWWCNEESEYDHMDITFDYVVWNEIKPYFTGNLNYFKTANDFESPVARGEMLKSNFELISTMDGDEEMFTVSEDAGKVNISLMHRDEGSQFIIANSNAEQIDFNLQRNKGINKGANSSVILDNPAAGKYSIATDADHFAAMVSYEKGATLLFDNSKIAYESGEAIQLNAEIKNVKEKATVTAVAIRKNNLKGIAFQNNDAIVLELEALPNGKYEAIIPGGLKEGVYNLTINAEADNFRRTIVSGFVVKAAKEINNELLEVKELSLKNFPNPVIDNTTIQFEIIKKGDAYLYLYDSYGRIVRTENVSEFEVGTHQLEWNMDALSNGNYFLELQNGKNKTTTNIIKLK